MSGVVVSMKAARTIRECKKLFQGYERRLENFEQPEFYEEVRRFQKELANYPHHLLTLVKGDILVRAISKRSVSEDVRKFAAATAEHLQTELSKRLNEY